MERVGLTLNQHIKETFNTEEREVIFEYLDQQPDTLQNAEKIYNEWRERFFKFKIAGLIAVSASLANPVAGTLILGECLRQASHMSGKLGQVNELVGRGLSKNK